MLSAARTLFEHRALLLTLTAREIKARYRGSALGFLWSLVNPLLLLAVYSFVFSVVLQQRAAVEPYALFLLCGLFPWIWFATSLTEGTVSLLANAGLIRRAVFPIELPVLVAGLAVGRVLGYPVGGWSSLALPAIALLQLVLTCGLALGLAALHVHFKDVKDILANLLTLFFFLTPVLYPMAAVAHPALRAIVRLSPMAPFVLAYQQSLFAGQVPSASLWLQMALVALCGWLVGAGLFARLRETLVEAA